MKQFIFVKTLGYDPTFGGNCSAYDGYCRIVRGEKVAINGTGRKIMGVDVVYCSPALRAIETARVLAPKARMVIEEDLREIGFDLGELLSKTEYEKQGSNLVRKRFIEAFVEDNLGESRRQIGKRIERVLGKISRLDEEKILVVSHSFLLKVVESLLKEETIFSNPHLLDSLFNYQKRTFCPGEGFEVCL